MLKLLGWRKRFSEAGVQGWGWYGNVQDTSQSFLNIRLKRYGDMTEQGELAWEWSLSVCSYAGDSMIVSVHAGLSWFSCQVALRDLVEPCMFTSSVVDSCRLTRKFLFISRCLCCPSENKCIGCCFQQGMGGRWEGWRSHVIAKWSLHCRHFPSWVYQFGHLLAKVTSCECSKCKSKACHESCLICFLVPPIWTWQFDTLWFEVLLIHLGHHRCLEFCILDLITWPYMNLVSVGIPERCWTCWLTSGLLQES